MSLDLIIETGSYTGNASSQSIAVGWQPDVVLIASSRSSGPANGRCLAFKTADMSGDDFIRNAAAASYHTVNGLSLTASGFSVGSEDSINNSGTIFHWMAIRGGPAIDVGTYTGSGGTTTITTGRQPVAVLLAQTTGTESFQIKSEDYSGSTNWIFTGTAAEGSNITLQSTGFQGTADADLSGETYMYVALYSLVGSTRHWRSGTYTGNGTSQAVALGAQPKWVTALRRAGAFQGCFKSSTMTLTLMGLLETNYSFTTGLTLTSTGFTATGADANASGDSYVWYAGMR